MCCAASYVPPLGNTVVLLDPHHAKKRNIALGRTDSGKVSVATVGGYRVLCASEEILEWLWHVRGRAAVLPAVKN